MGHLHFLSYHSFNHNALIYTHRHFFLLKYNFCENNKDINFLREKMEDEDN